jgi:hypothetical protein
MIVRRIAAQMPESDNHDAQRKVVWDDLGRRFRVPPTAHFRRQLLDRGKAEDRTREVIVRLARSNKPVELVMQPGAQHDPGMLGEKVVGFARVRFVALSLRRKIEVAFM